jgi:hypothetical protein
MMKLKGANFLELSLALAFALVVMAIALQLIQESTDRVNQGYSFHAHQRTLFQTFLKINQQHAWVWDDTTFDISMLTPSLSTTPTINVTHYAYSNQQWYETPLPHDVKKITMTIPQSEKSFSLFLASHPTISHLKGCLNIIQTALVRYNHLYQSYPPSHQLNYLIQTQILTELPNNPYTVADTSNNHNMNITDWHYVKASNQITVYAYTHPSIQLIISI